MLLKFKPTDTGVGAMTQQLERLFLFRGSGFNSQPQHSSLDPSATPVLGDLMCSFDFCEHSTQTYMQAEHPYTENKNK